MTALQISRRLRLPEPEMSMLLAAAAILVITFAWSTAQAAAPSVWNEPPAADTTINCAFGGAVVPCELVPSSVLDAIEARNRWLQAALKSEVQNHNTTLDLLAQAHERANRAEAERDIYRAQVASVPTWVWWTAIGLSSILTGGTVLWIAL